MKYTIGLDFGTLSARAVLVSVEDGKEIYETICTYRDGVISDVIPGTDKKVPTKFALQNPEDYIEALNSLLYDVAHNSGKDPKNIIGIGIDFTSCTILPLDKDIMPMMRYEKYRNSPHSWVKLWKHYGSEPQSKRIDKSIIEKDEYFIHRYGGDKSSCEWMFAKMLEIRDENHELYDDTYIFMEAGDWIGYLLTGNLTKSGNYASFKAMWSSEDGYPSADFLNSVENGFEDSLSKLGDVNILSPSEPVGKLTQEMAKRTGLTEGIRVAVPVVDSHAVVPAFGLNEDGDMVMVIGTSISHILLSSKNAVVPGILGMGKDGIIPGFYAYDAAQAAGGDSYGWVVDTCKSDFKTITEQMAELKPGESGLIALDWINGNRSILKDSDLTGLILGLNLNTKPSEIYRAFVEATAFGTRKIIDNYKKHGVEIKRLIAGGGIPIKSPEIMQIYADILGQTIYTGECSQPSALGSAIYAAAVAGKEAGGYDNIGEAIEAMSADMTIEYIPNSENKIVYDKMYFVYSNLYEKFSGPHTEMKEMLSIRNRQV